MKPSKTVWIILLGITILWLLSTNFSIFTFNYEKFGFAFKQLTGILAMVSMSVSVIITARLKILEPLFKGLDKGYRIHKLLGIWALIFSVLHWGWAEIPELLGLSSPDEDVAGPVLTGIEGFLAGYESLAHRFGEYGFYIAVVLIVIALLKSIPYHWFALTHRLFPIIYLSMVFHSIILMDFSSWLTCQDY